MIIAFTTKGTEWDAEMDPRFGRTEYILLYNEETKELTVHDNLEVSQEAHGVGPQTAQKLFDLDPDILITGNGPGGNAARVLKQSKMKIYIGAGGMAVKEAYQAFKKGELQVF